jgi:hypothetical protein
VAANLLLLVVDIVQQASEFHTMLSKMNTANSECSRRIDRQRILQLCEGWMEIFLRLTVVC